MRTWALIAGGGIVLGVTLALVLYAVRGPIKAPVLGPCTAEWLKLAPTISLDPTGQRADVGLTAPGPARCAVPSERPVMTVEVDSADGKRLLKRSRRLPPFPEFEVANSFAASITARALPLCTAKQPLHYVVHVMGLSASGDGVMRHANGRCYLG